MPIRKGKNVATIPALEEGEQSSMIPALDEGAQDSFYGALSLPSSVSGSSSNLALRTSLGFPVGSIISNGAGSLAW
jgi:hypothetical protein